jgi:hypothetical protein
MVKPPNAWVSYSSLRKGVLIKKIIILTLLDLLLLLGLHRADPVLVRGHHLRELAVGRGLARLMLLARDLGVDVITIRFDDFLTIIV